MHEHAADRSSQHASSLVALWGFIDQVKKLHFDDFTQIHADATKQNDDF